MFLSVVSLLLALALDYRFAEPKKYHPLIGFGYYVIFLQKVLNQFSQQGSHDQTQSHKQKRSQLIGGAVAALLAVTPIICLIVVVQHSLPDIVNVFVDAGLLYLCIGWSSLQQHAHAIWDELQVNQLDLARAELAKIVSRDTSQLDSTQVAQASVESVLENNQENVSFIKDSYLLYNRIDSNKRFENFLTGSSNKLAYEASLKITENASNYNPLYIYGGVGMGKTHLLNAIGLELKKNSKILFVSAERFMYQFVKSIKTNDMVKFKEYFRNTDVL